MSNPNSTIPSLPAGTIIPYGGPVDNAKAYYPDWVICDGSQYRQTDLPDLFDAIGISWGGDQTTHFRVPDLRGYFMRGVDDSSGRDPDVSSRTAIASGGNTGTSPDPVGSVQADEYKKHNHTYKNLPDSTGNYGKSDPYAAYHKHADADTTDSGGNETRPKNAYVYYLIRATNVTCE